MSKQEQPIETLLNGSENRLYGTFNESIRSREKLHHEALRNILGREKETRLGYRKARDLPVDDDVEIDASRRTTIINEGIGWAKIAALAALLGSVGVGGWLAGRQMVPKDEMPAGIKTEPLSDTNTHLRLRIANPD